MGKEKGRKEKEKSKSRKEKKSKKHKKHRRRSSSDSSDSDGSVERADQQLARERAAVSKLRDILHSYPAVRKELREMLWRVDQGEAANISGVPDPDLKASLAQLLELLRLRRNDKGIYGLIHPSEKILPVVSFVFDEQPRPRPQQQPPLPTSATAAATMQRFGDGGGGSVPPSSERPKAEEPNAEEEPARRAGPIGPTRPEPETAPVAGGTAQHEDEVEVEGSARDGAEEGVSGAGVPAAELKGEPEWREGGAAGPATVAAATSRRVAGPSMPPRELLDAAAAAAEAWRAAGPSYDEGEDDDELLVGPPPPELVEELEAAHQDEREAEVVRIIKVLREHSATGAGAGGSMSHLPPSPGAAADAYQVLGVSPSAGVGEVKKRYMRLSLLIHPDKCGHPLAHEAFQAVATSAKVLQDSELRGALDERRADAELRRRAEAAAAQQERERAWRVARGEEVPVASIGPVGPSGHQRETWMTELPPETVARPGAAGLSQTSVRAFSQRGKTGRGDTSGWTDNPEQRKAREAQALLAAASQAYVQALPSAGGDNAGSGGSGGGGRSGTAAAAMDSFNAGSRKKSLMEVHLELQERAKEEARAAKKAAKKQKTGGDAGNKAATGGGNGGGDGAADGRDWPWRPFDRERDLDLKPKAKSGADILKSAAALGSKFSDGGTQRHFL